MTPKARGNDVSIQSLVGYGRITARRREAIRFAKGSRPNHHR